MGYGARRQLREGDYRDERVVEVMGDGAGQGAERLEALGVVQLGLGVSGATCYRAFTLNNPSRLVIDIQAA